MLALRQNCVNPTTKQPYIVDSSGGRDNSPEGHQVVLTLFLPSPWTVYVMRVFANWLGALQGAFSHSFVTHFKDEEDRRYYLEEDPAHLAFVESLADIIQNVRVVDYSPGVF